MGNALNMLSCSFALFCANARSHYAEIGKTLVMSFSMLVQNLIFFAMWVVFFVSISQVKGWQLKDVALLIGIIGSSVGISLFVADGIRTTAQRVLDGSIDVLLTRPRHPLPALLFSRSYVSCLGDALSGPILWFTIGDATLAQVPLLLCLTLLSGTIFLSTIIVFYSLAFWIGKSSRFSDQLLETLIIFSTVPQHGQSLGIKIVMYSLLPAGFITLMPVSLLRNFDLSTFAFFVFSSILYVVVSVVVFNAGVKRYVAG